MSLTAWIIGGLLTAGLLSSGKKKEIDAYQLLSKQGDKMFDDAWAEREKRANERTAYDVLEIEPTASLAEIKKAYKEAAKKYHPDYNESTNAATKFRKVKKAYDLLKNTEKRAEYDATLLNRSEKVLLIGFSVQQLKLTLAENMKIDSKSIKFSQTDVFINDEFAGCWCIWRGFFVYYKPVTTPKITKFDPNVHEVILLTSYDMGELMQMIAMSFGCGVNAIDLNFFGVVEKYGEYALCWRMTDEDYFEYYCPTIPNEPEIAHVPKKDPDEFDFSDDEDDSDVKKLEQN